MSMNIRWIEGGIEMLCEEFGEDRVRHAIDAVKNFQVEIPGWALGTFGGGRFGGFSYPGAARNIEEKLDDAAFINHLTGCTKRFATHMLWDFSEDGMTSDYKIAERVLLQAKQRGLELGAVNPTYFLEGSHMGSFISPDEKTRRRYIDQTILAGKIAKELCNGVVTLWFPDGSLYPGQIDLKKSYERLKSCLFEAYSKMPGDILILIEYKVFEPGTYSTTIPDWGTSFALAKSLGSNVGVLVDLGHHYHGTNIEQIVMTLISENMKGGFHFNTRYAADDDESVEPNPEMARIFYELVKGDVVVNSDTKKNWAYMIDQCGGRENRIQALLHSVDSLQLSLAKGMLVQTEKLSEYQEKDEIILANRLFNNPIINADVRPIVLKARLEKNLPLDPIDAYIESGYQKKIESSRGN
ncbi:MAG TPA: L-rhamnose isomerase [Candidatus Ratteibacteria bacterium]|uniref:L-rhamnose isomerase n=1 Tax=candidate division TA06 bacterium ADurb.Bin131 TaxID=1852827 RepID=A0A1V6C6H8_UNCT6|nr:MAG: L-rhamnose isomerase [candidate division TA06 bacterium ADurb.Bin131]HPC29815.1 L-rhamnose isomerase [bacterium]HRS06654.1 L-rhamnose isomerase [Candidatus Ratteibacteria bacterium]HRV05063.1 L-rhamnose isomerase [Candidatus Ratteibacteria bacterium]